MESFTTAAGIDVSSLSYIIIPTLMVTAIAALVVGLVHSLEFVRSDRLSPSQFLNGVFKSVAAVIAIVSFIYFLYKEYSV